MTTMKQAPVPTLFAQILGLVVISLVATAIVGVCAILLAPQTDERFTYGELRTALETKQPVRSESSGRWLSVSYKDAPPPQPEGQLAGVRFFVAGSMDVDFDDVVYW